MIRPRRSASRDPYLVEHDRGALPGNAVLPVIVGGVHRRAAEQTSDGAGSIRTIISNATPDRRGANVTSVVVGDKRLHSQELLRIKESETSTFVVSILHYA